MAQTEHRLEQRSNLLAVRLGERVSAFRDALAPPGQRPPFTTAKSEDQALDWWARHRYDDLGKQVLARFAPQQVAELDVALARRNQIATETGQPIAAPSLNGGEPSVA